MGEIRIGPIRDIALGIYDGPHATPKEADDGPIFLGIKNVTPQGALDFSDIRYISEADYPKWTKRVVPQEDDIVFSYEATLHRYAIIPKGFRGCLGRRMALIRPDKTKVDPRFLHYYFMTPAWRMVVESNVVSGATVDRIPLIRFPDFELRLPALHVQHRIASVLSAYDDLIENNRRRIRLLEQAARLLYREWFVHLRYPGHEHTTVIDGVPAGWERKNLRTVAEIKGGKQYQGKGFNSSGNVPVFGGNGIQGYSQKRTHNGFVIIFGRVSANCGSIHWSYDGAWVNNNASSIVPNSYDELILQHLLHYDFIRLRKGAAQPFIPNSILSNVKLLIPAEILATKFCKLVGDIRHQQQSLSSQIRLLMKARDVILPYLMDGRVEL